MAVVFFFQNTLTVYSAPHRGNAIKFYVFFLSFTQRDQLKNNADASKLCWFAPNIIDYHEKKTTIVKRDSNFPSFCICRLEITWVFLYRICGIIKRLVGQQKVVIASEIETKKKSDIHSSVCMH